MTRSFGIWWEFSRPFTLLMPMVGMFCGGLVALGAHPRYLSNWSQSPWTIGVHIVLGAIMAAVMNAGSNGLNQIFDLAIDRINKPTRPLPSGRMSMRQAWVFTGASLTGGLALAGAINSECLLMAALAAIFTACYSVPPVRTKRWGILAGVTMAIPRGFLLLVAGWSTVKSIWTPEPWLLSSALGLYILGASVTKDFSDIEGDRAGECRTLPVLYGVRRTAVLIAPFFVFPFMIWAWLMSRGLLSANPLGVYSLSVVLPMLGAYIDFRILLHPEELSSGENHISWRLIYLMAMIAYGGLALAYNLPPVSPTRS